MSNLFSAAHLGRSLHRFAHHTGGNIAILAAVSMPVIVLSAGVAVDFSTLYSARSELQKMADSAAIAATRELILANSTKKTATAIARNFVRANLSSRPGMFSGGVKVSTTIDKSNSVLTVTLLARKKNAFGKFLRPEYSDLKAFARARAVGDVNICMLGLDQRKPGAIALNNAASIVANNCGVYSNSTSRKGIKLDMRASMQAQLICSAGGTVRSRGTFSPAPVTDCPPLDDPLQSRAPLRVGACDFNDMRIKNKVVTIDPGVYCGGLRISGNSSVIFRPGIYVMKDGRFLVKNTASATGQNTGFYFTGSQSRFVFAKGTTIEFTAPKDGGMAGMLFFQDPNAPPPSPDDSDTTANQVGRFEIRSNNARILLGTIYLPRGKLFVKSDKPISDRSAYTVVIAKRMTFFAGPTMVLNSNFSDTDVPIPAGIIGKATRVMLTD